ncbi:MAG: hypothetical protein Fur007_13200 [Rhodoferax sp.]
MWVDADTVLGSPARRLAADFDLQGTPERGQLLLLTPLGSTAAHITWQSDGAQLDDRAALRNYPSLEALLHDVLGTALPIRAWFDWLQGRAHDAPGWQVDLADYPKGRLRAQRNAPQPGVQLKVTLDRPNDQYPV